MDPTIWAQLGIAGAILGAFVLGYIVPVKFLERAEARADKMEQQRDQAREDIVTQFVPVIERALSVFSSQEQLNADQRQALLRVEETMTDVRRLLERER